MPSQTHRDPQTRPVALITGAGSGIGRATALQFARRRWRLLLAGRRREPLETLARELQDSSGLPREHIRVEPADVGRSDDVHRMVEAAIQSFQRIDVLMNNAGRADLRPIDQTDPKCIEQTFRINAIGPAIAIHLLWPIFISQGEGCIINISTAGTADPFPGFFAYAASKASVNLMARSAAGEGAEHGIRAFSIAPGAVETPMLRSLFDQQTLPESACLNPDDVADLITRCVDGHAESYNGRTVQIVQTDGKPVEQILF